MAEQPAPHDLAAETGVLGAMLLSADACSTALAALSADDFYSPGHGHVFDAVVGLWSAGRPVDPVTVADELRTRGLLEQAGGPAELVRLARETPALSNVGRYAGIVAEHAQRRALLHLAAEVADRARALDHPGDIAADLATAAGGVGGHASVPEGFDTLDGMLAAAEADPEPSAWVVPGLLRRSWRAIVTGGEGGGKGLALDTPLPTPAGWTTMGAVAVGDQLIGSDGRPCTVTAVSAVHHRPCYRVLFDDGAELVADDEHRWVVVPYHARQHNRGHQRSVVSTSEMAGAVRARDGFVANFAVPVAAALDVPDAELPVDPYVLGAWLGDGSSDSTKLQVRLRALGVLGDKHVPDLYLRGSAPQRLALLTGLVDADGHVHASGGVSIDLCNERLARDVAEVARSLGFLCSLRPSDATINGRVIGTRWRMNFHPGDVPVAVIRRKAERQRARSTSRGVYRYVTAVEPVPRVPTRCVAVDSPDCTYLAGDRWVVTHNTTLLRQVAVAASAGIHPLTRRNCDPVRVLSIDLENPPEAVAETCAPMIAAARTTRASYDPNRHWFWHRPGGIDVRSRRGRDELEGAIRASAPDLVAVGPVYKLSRAKASEGWEGPALEVAGVLDDLRTRYGFALLLEAHPAKGESSRKRDLRPEGSSLWMKWPELGFGLAVDRDRGDRVEIVRWRGDRLPNQWPVALTRSTGGWPWSGEWAAGTFDPEHPEDPAPMF